MEYIGISLKNILDEYKKYFLSKLINKEYDFNILKNMVKEFSKTSDLFDYNDDLTEKQIITEINKKQNELLNSYKNDD